ncbi:hypothetical protein BT96DRAFT_514642 [Gymnopus androsaceus JB14]|uniref:Uncharacterized protein n=1 Tax=Gymnopus androsaceus JB14 TaxID=1447944 RepID=A0A6A4GLR5_9AGAR|nr:hypothetical protein BT96DRAFT_514642 [Gymnopus androsaceus JB14]
MPVEKEEGCLSEGVALSVAGSRRIRLLRRANFPRYQHHRVYTIYPHPSSRVFIRNRQLNSGQEKDGNMTEERGEEDRTDGVGDEDASVFFLLFLCLSFLDAVDGTEDTAQRKDCDSTRTEPGDGGTMVQISFSPAQAYLPTRLYFGIVSFSTFEFVAFCTSVLGNRPLFSNFFLSSFATI